MLNRGASFFYHSYPIHEDYVVDLEKALGEGGFSQVCIAKHRATKVERACKRIRRADIRDAAAFEKEVDGAA